jgi:ADP-ribose pyrophosphatase
MPKPNNVGVGVAALVIDADTHDLHFLKRKGAHAEDTIACPGGWIDFEDESPEDAAVRELKEELDLTVSPDELEQVCNVSEMHEDLGIRTVTLYYKVYVTPSVHGVPKIGEPSKSSELRIDSVRNILMDTMLGNIKLFPKLGNVLL